MVNNKYIMKIILVILTILFLISLISIIAYFWMTFSSRQECGKQALIEIYQRQISYKTINKSYSDNLTKIGFAFKRHCGYSFYMANDSYVSNSMGKGEVAQSIPRYLNAYYTHDEFNVFAIGNLDNDNAYDIWMITEKGHPLHIQDDRYLEYNP